VVFNAVEGVKFVFLPVAILFPLIIQKAPKLGLFGHKDLAQRLLDCGELKAIFFRGQSNIPQ